MSANINYDAIIAHFRQRLEREKAQVARTETILEGLEEDRASIQSPLTPAPAPAPERQQIAVYVNGQLATLADYAEAALREAGTSLHLTRIIEWGTAHGRLSNEGVWRDALTRKDSAGRFRPLGRNVFDLSERHPREGN